jgi:hypothetical protein
MMADKEKAIANLYESLYEMNILRKPEAKHDGWISVEDRLPGPGTYLCCFILDFDNIEYLEISARNTSGGEPWWSCFGLTGSDDERVHPTHWMPLPDPPERAHVEVDEEEG